MTVYAKPPVRSAWAETAAVSDITDPGNTFVSAGWALGVKPPRQYFNWVLNYTFAAVRYFCQVGMPDWDAAETYPAQAWVRSPGGYFSRSIQANNVGHNPDTTTGWWSAPPVLTAAQNSNDSTIANTSWVHGNFLPLGSNFSAIGGSIQNVQVPVGAVTQWQGSLSIAGSQVGSAVAQANTIAINGGYRSIQWNGQSGQPNWLIGSSDGANFLVWNPANFHVANSDQLAGLSPSTGAAGSTVAVRDSNGYLVAQYLYQASSNNENPAISQLMVTNGADGFLRKASVAAVKAALGALGLSNFPASLAANGYLQIPTSTGFNLIVQWGLCNPNGSTIFAAWPIAFAHQCFSAVGTSTSVPTQCNITGVGTTGMTIANTGGQSFFISVGY